MTRRIPQCRTRDKNAREKAATARASPPSVSWCFSQCYALDCPPSDPSVWLRSSREQPRPEPPTLPSKTILCSKRSPPGFENSAPKVTPPDCKLKANWNGSACGPLTNSTKRALIPTLKSPAKLDTSFKAINSIGLGNRTHRVFDGS